MDTVHQVIGTALFARSLLDVPLKLDPVLPLSLATSLMAELGLNALLYLEQRRASKPSHLATLYLLAAVLCDLVALTVPSAAHRPTPTRCLLHVSLLALECFLPHAKPHDVSRMRQAPEDKSGVLGRLFFVRINPILLRGYKSLLLGGDLPPLSRELNAKSLRDAMVESWCRRGQC